MVRVKICGITNWQDAQAACDLGAAALGFNFYEKSARVISPSAAWKIISRLGDNVESVGVFVNWSAAAVIALARALSLESVQLHGDEIPSVVRECAKDFRVTKAFQVGAKFQLKKLRSYSGASAFLFDADGTGQYGGTGKRADWTVAHRAAKSHRIILAGGLTPENVGEAIRFVRPYAVDVASGVESRPGKKDRSKLREFFAEVESANRELEVSGRKQKRKDLSQRTQRSEHRGHGEKELSNAQIT
jgi:phosphoribosylanthranilate isomerase